MELFSPEFCVALMSIVLIDLVLAGDNAIVIGMAARNVPVQHRKQVIVWGTVGAIVIRALATLAVVWLLQIPGLLAIGGIMLIWIAYKLLTEENSHNYLEVCDNRWKAIKTIIVADAVMGLDNVLGVAGSAHGSFVLVVCGLLISIPIVVWGSTLILKCLDRFPVIIYLGAGVIALTAAKMILEEPFIEGFIYGLPLLKYSLIAAAVCGVLMAGKFKNKQKVPATSKF